MALRLSTGSEISDRLFKITINLLEQALNGTTTYTFSVLVGALRIYRDSWLVFIRSIIALTERLIEAVVCKCPDSVCLPKDILTDFILLQRFFRISHIIGLGYERIEQIPCCILTSTCTCPVRSRIETIVKIEPSLSLRVHKMIFTHKRTDNGKSRQSRIFMCPTGTPAIGIHHSVNTIHGTLRFLRIPKYLRTGKCPCRSGLQNLFFA